MGYRQTQTALATLWMSSSESWIDFIFSVFWLSMAIADGVSYISNNLKSNFKT